MRSILAALILLYSSSLLAQVAAVNVFVPPPGKAQFTAQYFLEAKGIHEALGAQVALSNDLKGHFRYAMLFENWEAYGEFSQSLGSSEAWQAFQAKRIRNPAAVQTDNLLLNQVAAPSANVGGPGSVTQITVWELTAGGTMGEMIEGGLGAKPIHERAGANVSIYAGGGNRMYYLQQFENMAAWGRFRDTPNPEFNAYMQSLRASGNAVPFAVIVNQVTQIAF
jgi:cysteine synthase